MCESMVRVLPTNIKPGNATESNPCIPWPGAFRRVVGFLFSCRKPGLPELPSKWPLPCTKEATL